MSQSVWAVVPAAGRGLRMGAAVAKQYLGLAGAPLVSRTCAVLQRVDEVVGVVLVVPPADVDSATRRFVEPYGLDKVAAVVAGGRQRQDSVAAGVREAVARGAGWIVVHDAVRPLAGPEVFGRVLAAAREVGAAAAGWPVVDTVKRAAPDGRVQATLEREGLWLVQTPQAFKADLLRQAQQRAAAEGFTATDEAGLVEHYGGEVRMVKGQADNLKITTPGDLRLAAAWAAGPAVRVGQGYDVHRLVSGRRLVLGGVEMDFDLGLEGHSDADVLTHAVMDALLAAAGLGDIGRMFPDSDPAWAGADSIDLLGRVCRRLARAGWRPAQVSVTLLAQRPKIAPRAGDMAVNLAGAMGIPPAMVNVAASTTEGLGFIGRGQGMAAMASATITPAPAALEEIAAQ